MPNSSTLQELAERIYQREVVFFVGAGCSLDSEGNSARRLMMRLVIRFLALRDAVLKLSNFKNAQHPDIADLAERFEKTFGIKAGLVSQEFVLETLANLAIEKRKTVVEEFQSEVGKLAAQYYESNDWFCSAYQRLLLVIWEISLKSQARKKSKAKKKSTKKTSGKSGATTKTISNDQLSLLVQRINEIEESYRVLELDEGERFVLDDASFKPIDPIFFRWAASEKDHSSSRAGKALFLDTLGFSDSKLMGGKPLESGKELAASFAHKLFPRHHVMARFAREGLCPTIITTNYDMLLDGAWRTAGFNFESNKSLSSPRVPIPRLARIATPHDYQVHGKAVDTTLLVKVHGCADQYRLVRSAALAEQENCFNPEGTAFCNWAKYLDSIVFTYREIQNWRSDSWSRDFLANVQRTKSVAFVGYSLQDPVIHDSFRTVYEQMAQSEPLLPQAKQLEHTPAYFFGQTDKQPFYAMEVLNSATRATGKQPQRFNEHDNYIGINFRNRNHPSIGPFPHLDDVFLWLNHHVTRRTQLDSLKDELAGVYQNLLREVLLPGQQEILLERFKRLIAREEEDVSALLSNENEAGVRDKFQKTVGWTYWFHPRLLREFAISHWIDAGPSYQMNSLRESEWYFPASARRDWTAWSVVVELAIRSLMDSVTKDKNYRPVEAGIPAIVFQRESEEMGNELLTLQVGDFERSGPALVNNIAVGFECMWTLEPKSAPWSFGSPNSAGLNNLEPRKRPFGRINLNAPTARLIWDWAIDPNSISESDNYLGTDPTVKLGVGS